MDLDAYFCKATFYVRPERTLLVGSVGRRVGGPGSLLWRGGWALGVSAGDLRPVSPERLMDRLFIEFSTRNDARPLSAEARQAWQRTWRNSG